ncbi:MAG: ribbon-helix-helix domain-containing protein [Spirochaetota bacterium]
MVGKRKEEIITFKVDEALASELKHIPNRSQFIRDALLSALKNECPVCHGSGTLTPNQMKHWQEFAEHHHVAECGDCNETYLVCDVVDTP